MGMMGMTRGFSNVKEHFAFHVVKEAKETAARCGKLVTPHGIVHTPAFIFCGTKACVKGVTVEQLRGAGTQFVLGNTYHLWLQPGPDVIKASGGLQEFTGWKGPMLTDSGGYQIFSMGYGSVSSEIKGRKTSKEGHSQSVVKLTEEGAYFRAYTDGTMRFLSPEISIQAQRDIGADIVLVLDECTPFNVDKEYTAESMRRSHRWATRSLEEFRRSDDGNDNFKTLFHIHHSG